MTAFCAGLAVAAEDWQAWELYSMQLLEIVSSRTEDNGFKLFDGETGEFTVELWSA